MRGLGLFAILGLGMVCTSVGGCANPKAGRYQMVSAGSSSTFLVYRLDTHTGEMLMINGDDALPVEVRE